MSSYLPENDLRYDNSSAFKLPSVYHRRYVAMAGNDQIAVIESIRTTVRNGSIFTIQFSNLIKD